MSKWEWKKLGEVCSVKCGATPLKSDKSFWERGTVPWFTVDDIHEQGRVINSTKKAVTEKALKKLTLFPKKTVLLCCTASVGEYAISNIEVTCNQQFNGLIVRDKNYLDPNYLFHFASTLKEKLLSVSGKTTIDFISNSKVCDIDIPIPPLSEQKRIVKFLDEEFSKIDTLKTNAETNLKNAKALYQKSLDKIIEDECRRYTLTSLKEITTKIGSGATPKGGKKIYQTEGISLIRSMNVLYGSFSYDNLAHINKKQAKALDGVAIQCADVLFNITGASIARCCVVPDDVIPARVNQHVSILRPIQKVLNSDYLSVVLLASQNQKKLLDIGEAGATRQALTKGDLEVFQIPLPPLSVQKKIVARLDKLSENVKRLEANYKQIIADCDKLKKSILKKTFERES